MPARIRRRKKRRSRNGSRRAASLLRFAGPHIAEQSDNLLPVRVRRGGRTIGGALSWEKPAKLAPFAPESPFAGLAIPADVTVARQVLAEPDLDLANKTWARLADGTPLVTAEKLGKGWTVLVHTTANTEWSNLALSGLFVRDAAAGRVDEPGRRGGDRGRAAAARDAGRVRPTCSARRRPPGRFPARTSPRAMPSPRHPPGFYGAADTRRALNLSAAIGELKPIGDLPDGVARETFGHKSEEVDFRPPLLTAAFLLALIDLLDRLRAARPVAAAAGQDRGRDHADRRGWLGSRRRGPTTPS